MAKSAGTIGMTGIGHRRSCQCIIKRVCHCCYCRCSGLQRWQGVGKEKSYKVMRNICQRSLLGKKSSHKAAAAPDFDPSTEEDQSDHDQDVADSGFDPTSIEDPCDGDGDIELNVEGVIPDQWIALVNNWMTTKAQDISNANRINCSKRKAIHTAGTKSFARNREELRQKDPEKKNPHRAVLYIHTHQASSSKNAHVGELKELLVQHPDLAETSGGKVAWKGDALTRILGEERPGHVHGLGLVPNPEKVLDCSKSGRLKHLNVTSLDATSSEDVVSLRLQVEKLVNKVQGQDATIQNLQQKTISLEQQQRQHGCLDDHLFAPDTRKASKQKGVDGENPSQGYRMHDGDPINYTMGEQSDDEFEDLYPSNRKTQSIAKMKAAMAREENLLHTDRVATSYKAKPKEFYTGNRGDNYKYATASKRFLNDAFAAPTIGTTALKRKRVHVEPARYDYRMHNSDTVNYTMGEQSEDEFEDLQESNQRTCATNKGTMAAEENFQRSDGDRVTAAHKVRNKEATPNCSKQEKYQVGTHVFIKSWRQKNRNIALGTILCIDPNDEVGGLKLGKEFLKLDAGAVAVRDEPLVRPYGNFKVLGDVGSNLIAWPSTCVQKRVRG